MDNNNNQHAITRIETFGVEQIPDHERNATPVDLFRMIFGGANTFATAVLGSFPVLFGLSFQAGLWAILLGVTLGALILAPMGLFGPLNGTNNAVSSGAHFGVHGRIVGSFLSLLTAIAFFSLSVWSSGDALVGGARRLVGLEESELNLGLAYGLFAVLVLTVCIYGFRFMLLVNRIAVWAASLLFLLGLFAFAGPFDAAYAGSVQLGQPGFWAAFIGATLLAMSNPISFGAFLGDWARYIPRQTSQARIMLAVIGAQLATLVPFLFGLATATIVAVRAPDYIAANNYVGGLLAIAPGWFFLPVCLIAVIGGMSTGTTSLYGTGLDMSSVFPRLLSRVQATVLIGVASIGFIFVGRFAFNLVQSVSTFAVLIVTCTTPWMVIMLIGLLTVAASTARTTCKCSPAASAAAPTGSSTAGTGAEWAPGFPARQPAWPSSTCRGNSSVRSANWPAASTSACRSPSAWPPCSTWHCCACSRNRLASTARKDRAGCARTARGGPLR